LRERFWANGFELAQTVENPEPFLAPLPSLWAVSSESELLQRSSSRFTGQFFSGWNMRFESVCIPSDLFFRTPSHLSNRLVATQVWILFSNSSVSHSNAFVIRVHHVYRFALLKIGRVSI
jgi:hypothetical protein